MPSAASGNPTNNPLVIKLQEKTLDTAAHLSYPHSEHMFFFAQQKNGWYADLCKIFVKAIQAM